MPVAVGDQERGCQIGIGAERDQIAVHRHRALRVTGQDDLGGGALRGERRVLRAQGGRPGIHAAHVVKPVPYAGIGGHILGWIVDGLSGDGAALSRELLLESLVRLVDDLAHAIVGGDVVLRALTGAGGTHPVDVRATRAPRLRYRPSTRPVHFLPQRPHRPPHSFDET